MVAKAEVSSWLRCGVVQRSSGWRPKERLDGGPALGAFPSRGSLSFHSRSIKMVQKFAGFIAENTRWLIAAVQFARDPTDSHMDIAS